MKNEVKNYVSKYKAYFCIIFVYSKPVIALFYSLCNPLLNRTNSNEMIRDIQWKTLCQNVFLEHFSFFFINSHPYS